MVGKGDAFGDFPGDPVVEFLSAAKVGAGWREHIRFLVGEWETKIPHAVRQRLKQKIILVMPKLHSQPKCLEVKMLSHSALSSSL